MQVEVVEQDHLVVQQEVMVEVEQELLVVEHQEQLILEVEVDFLGLQVLHKEDLVLLL
jgi:hypothetical protein